MPAFRSILLVFFTCLVLGGCPGTLDDPNSFRPCTPETVPTVLFPRSCANSLCHDDKNPEGSLDLKSPDLVSRLIGVNAKAEQTDGGPYECQTRLLIDPDTPSQSFLIEKVSKTKPECGDQMPATGSLSAQEIQCITDWVNSVANGGAAGSAGSAGSSTTDASDDGATAADTGSE